jgi:hypothetical protein
MRAARCLLAGVFSLGFGACAALVSGGCSDESKTSGTHVEMSAEQKEQMQSERESTEAAVKERRAAARARRGGR